MFRSFTQFVTAIIFIAVSTFTSAQRDTSITYELEDSAVVVASRYEVPLKHVNNTFELIMDEKSLASADHSALELVDYNIPGAYVLDKKVIGYGVGTAGGGLLNLRGYGGKPNSGVLMLINGHPDIMGLFGHPLPDVYGIEGVQRIEVLSGASSTVFGSNAIGGVVNIVTGPDYSNTVIADLEYGSFNTYNASASFNQAFSNSGVSLYLNTKNTDGHIDQSGFQSMTFQGSGFYDIHDKFSIKFNARYVPYSFDDPARTTDPAGLGKYAEIERAMGSLTLENRGENIKGSTQIFGNYGDHKFADGFESNDQSIGISSYQQIKVSDDLAFAAGGDFINYGGETNFDNKEHTLSALGIYALGLYTPVPYINLKAGLRYQHNSLPLDKISPSAGLSVIPFENLNVFVNYQSGFRYPTMQELYIFPVSTSSLIEENAATIETGLKYYYRNFASFGITYFQNRISDMITLVSNSAPPPPVKYANSGEAEQWGIETSAGVRLFNFINAKVMYSYLEPDIITAYNPEQQYKYHLQAEYSDISAMLYGKYVHKLYADNNEASPLPDYNLVNIMVSYKFSNFVFHVKANNLLDREYFVLPGYEAPGLHFLAGIKFNLK